MMPLLALRRLEMMLLLTQLMKLLLVSLLLLPRLILLLPFLLLLLLLQLQVLQFVLVLCVLLLLLALLLLLLQLLLQLIYNSLLLGQSARQTCDTMYGGRQVRMQTIEQCWRQDKQVGGGRVKASKKESRKGRPAGQQANKLAGGQRDSQ